MNLGKNILMKKISLQMLIILAVMLILTVISVFVLAFLMYNLRFDESKLKICVGAIYFVVNIIGGFMIGKLADRKRLPFGMAMGYVYFVCMFILSIILKGIVGAGDFPVAFAAVLSIAGGGFGGSIS